MKNFSFLIAITFLIFSFNLVSASFTANYPIVDQNDNPLSGVNVEGYVCLNAECYNLGSSVSGLTDYEPGSTVHVVFPTTLMNSNGYLLYFYKDGYIGWEQTSITLAGTGTGTSPTAIKLIKKTTGVADIAALNYPATIVQNDTVQFQIVVDSPIQDTRVSNVVLQEDAEVKINFELKNEADAVVCSGIQYKHVAYSGTTSANFSCTFNAIGNFTPIAKTMPQDRIITPVEDILIGNKIVILAGDNPVEEHNCTYYGNCTIIPPANCTDYGNCTIPPTNCTTYGNCTIPVTNCTYYGNCTLPSNGNESGLVNIYNLTFPANVSLNTSTNLNFSYDSIFGNATVTSPRSLNLTISLFEQLLGLLNRTNQILTGGYGQAFNTNYTFSQPGNYTLNILGCTIPILVNETSVCVEKTISFVVLNNSGNYTNCTGNCTIPPTNCTGANCTIKEKDCDKNARTVYESNETIEDSKNYFADFFGSTDDENSNNLNKVYYFPLGLIFALFLLILLVLLAVLLRASSK